ncbi:hypothetical protein Tco_1201151 [Tanacetum coccineum]
MYYEFREAFHRLFNADAGTFKDVLSRNMQNLERQLNKETLHEKDSNVNAFNSEFKERIQKYSRFDDQSFKDSMIRHMDFIKKYTLETILHQQEIQQLLNEKKLQTQEV